jgi:glycosyltransferase involved in cell wall biosynthesis
MKIAFVAPGEMNIPTNGWGALETVVWNQHVNLNKMGHETFIINENNTTQTYQKIIDINPDIVHLHYGKHWQIMPYLKCKKIITSHDGGFLYSQSFHKNLIKNFFSDCIFFILTSWEKELLLNNGINEDNIKILPNGVDNSLFRVSDNPQFVDKSICLGKIDSRKRQPFLQSLNCNICFAGQNTTPEFNPLDDNYLGLWNRNDVYNNLTEYANFILLSASELHPLVCLEALASGLGLVVSEAAAQNLDPSKPFISIIDQKDINNQEIVYSTIIKNREACSKIDRKSITDYAKTFDWTEILKKYESYL